MDARNFIYCGIFWEVEIFAMFLLYMYVSWEIWCHGSNTILYILIVEHEDMCGCMHHWYAHTYFVHAHVYIYFTSEIFEVLCEWFTLEDILHTCIHIIRMWLYVCYPVYLYRGKRLLHISKCFRWGLSSLMTSAVTSFRVRWSSLWSAPSPTAGERNRSPLQESSYTSQRSMGEQICKRFYIILFTCILVCLNIHCDGFS